MDSPCKQPVYLLKAGDLVNFQVSLPNNQWIPLVEGFPGFKTSRFSSVRSPEGSSSRGTAVQAMVKNHHWLVTVLVLGPV